jgi:uncharacterized damage-inducible protein DinB
MTSTTYLTDNAELLRQGVDAIRQLGADVYRRGDGASEVSPPGAHFRHVFDHYQAFLDGRSGGRINYDDRTRDVRLEQEADAATAKATALVDLIAAIDAKHLADPLQVSANVVMGGRSVVDWTPSTVQRELMYLLSHTVHHYAIIRLLASSAGVELHRDFGVAPSTLAHRSLLETCAPSAG